MSNKAEVVTITWMDGQEREYEGDVETKVSDGVLHIYKYSGVVRILQEQWHFPLANIRVWKKEDVKAYA